MDELEMMMTIDQLIGRLMNLENKYYELQSKYQTLIHQYEELKQDHENCPGHRNESSSRQDSSLRNEEH